MATARLQKRLTKKGGKDTGYKEYWQYILTIPSKVAEDAALHGGQKLWLNPRSIVLIGSDKPPGTPMTVHRKRTRQVGEKTYYVTSLRIPRTLCEKLMWEPGMKINIEAKGATILFYRQE